MISLGLRSGEMDDFKALLAAHHSIYIRLQILNMDHKMLSDVSKRLIDGQVNIDNTSEITRSLDVDLLDPTGALHLDGTGSPNDGAVFADRMMRVYYVVMDPGHQDSYSTPIFTGPITKLERTGALLNVECQGKEVLSLAPVWNGRTFKKGMRKTQAIRYILREMGGENRMDIPERTAKLPRNLSVGADTTPWKAAKHLAWTMGCQLFYDGRGVVRMRRYPTKSVYTFRGGRGGTVKTSPEVGFNMDDVVNAVEVTGKKPKGWKHKIRVREIAPRANYLSPWSLGRSGGPRFLPLRIEDDNIASVAAARSRAREELRKGLIQSIEAAYDSLVVPFLEEGDYVRLHTEEYAVTHHMRKFSIPLTAGGDMSIGYVKNVKVARRRAYRARRRSRQDRSRK